MTINNNLNAMVASELQFQDMATNLATVANTVAEPEFQEVTSDLIDSITGQIPQIISYSANAQNIELQGEMLNTLLNIKA
ncbi:hypothetical protein [Aliarcobacter butzleri]|uniref:hypothetical protein n=1 Tax=Aliarcobacter butzleri TaxID=28197 RepID=UPI0021B5F214|nr:hypothetical protein [Aliarcobacter butzleri]MCT7636295.1 hypothetical protein [Aliarcobacter butzleri]MDK2046530.1 hypothetical protein [Aliarcobacter butzleri]